MVVKTVLEINNQPPPTLKLILGSIQLARRTLAFESAQQALPTNQADVDGRADKQTQCEIDGRMDELLVAIANFRPRCKDA